MGDISRFMVGAIIIAAVATGIGMLGALVVTYWPIILIAVAGLIGGIVYMKRQKRVRNMV